MGVHPRAIGHADRMPTFMCIAYVDQEERQRPHRASGVRMDGSDGRLLERGAAIAGMACIEAPDGEEAARIMAEAPSTGRHGVIEAWPLRSPASA